MLVLNGNNFWQVLQMMAAHFVASECIDQYVPPKRKCLML